MTLGMLLDRLPPVPMSTSWLIADLAEAKGKQELFTKQSPQKLKILREHAIIESAVSSNRIEGVTIDPGENTFRGKRSKCLVGKDKLKGIRYYLMN